MARRGFGRGRRWDAAAKDGVAMAMNCVAVASDRAAKRSLAMRRHGTVMISTGDAQVSIGERRHWLAETSIARRGTC